MSLIYDATTGWFAKIHIMTERLQRW